MHYLIAILLALLSIIVVSYPLLKSRRPDVKPEYSSDSKGPLSQMVQQNFDEIDRLQLEYELGVIDPEDYQRQMDELRRAAAQTLRAYDHELRESAHDSPTATDMDDLLEERIRQRRHSLRLQDTDNP